MISRRKLLTRAPFLGAAAALFVPAGLGGSDDRQFRRSATEVVPLGEGWEFRLDPAASRSPSNLAVDDSEWQIVRVPHTWQAIGGFPEYVGVAWYRTKIFAPKEWRASFVRTEFEAVFHSARIFLNGAPVGEHVGKGYTAFTCDLTAHLQYGQTNELSVRVDNSFSDTMLPRMKSFDWANDGGIIRPVHLLITPPVFIDRVDIDAVPDLKRGTARVSVTAAIRNTLMSEVTTQVSATIRPDDSTALQNSQVVSERRIPPGATTIVDLDPVHLESATLWHFDAPHLYWADVSILSDECAHTLGDHFGIRQFEIRDTSFYLNGERVSLMGVERMAGSNPKFGMAEQTEWIDANHRDMKELNCVFTRVHWPQDRRVLDFCDRHGILMQEEVPAWGSFTFENISADLLSRLEANGLEQLREMVGRDRNHPCIVSWGLCNEVNGKNPQSRKFAQTLAQEARKLDSRRLLTYASHTLREHPEQDMAGDFDFISANEYFGRWYPGGPEEVRQYLARIRDAFPNKPIVVSEYGWCECQPAIQPGDENRAKIVNEHTQVLRESGEVAGAIYFDYNDYRTLVGDKGTGAFRQRVHGVVDLYGNRKPSFDALRQQSSPIRNLFLTQSEGGFTLQIETRKALSGYELRDYSVRWVFYGYDDLPMEGQMHSLGPAPPGQRVTVHVAPANPEIRRVVVDILRPTGFSAVSAEVTM
jgi:beta-galactosidase